MNSLGASVIARTESIYAALAFALICDAFAFVFASVVRRCYGAVWMLSGQANYSSFFENISLLDSFGK